MNRIILKQISKKQEQKQKEKPKEKAKITQDVIKVRLLKHFQHHIGESDKTTSEEIFQVVMGFSSFQVDSFSKFYWWEQIEKIIRGLRRKNIAFIIKKKGYYFVLKDEDEADFYINRNDDTIKKIENANDRAKEWVEKEKWKEFEKRKIEEVDFTPVTKPTKPKGIDTYKGNLKTKVIKLWKGEK